MTRTLATGARLAVAGSAGALAIGLFSAGAANADTFVPLPDGQIVKTLSDGTVITLSAIGQSANISPSMGATPVHRNVWVSGTATVHLDGGDGSIGWIQPGYIVGCQVNISGGGVGGDAGVAGAGQSVTGTAGANANLSLGPGQVVNYNILDLEYPDNYGNERHDNGNAFYSKDASVSWSDSTLGVTGCAGYAQARNYVSLEIETSNVISYVTLWGQPFSIG
ncbi:MspA family porin [Nocardia sp. R6R-6]|uniref:MspA family porin n=1 Tax=Nocardia sp. R6R-6 TaxID=3459303 RepID=UPI00403E3169